MHQAGGRHLHGGAVRLLVDEETAGRRAKSQSLGERQGAVAVLAQHPVAARLGAGSGMGVDRAALGDPKAFGGQCLDADIVGAGGDRGLDARLEQLLEGSEEPVLHRDAQGQHAIEELRDRRQFLAQRAVLVEEIETGRVLEFAERAATRSSRVLAGVKQLVELPQRRLGIGAFEIVVGAEQALAAGLALAAGDRAQTCRDGARSSTESASRP